jgi:hypothetical protein
MKITAIGAASGMLLATLLAGCASIDRTPSYLVGERWYKSNMDTQPVIILGVDNWDTTQRRVLVDPGMRTVRVQALPVPGAPQETSSIKIDVKPCFTYYIVAWRENPISAQFTPKVDYAEPLGGCDPNAGQKKG